MHRLDLLARRDGRALRPRKDVAVFRIAIRSAGAVAALTVLVSLTGCEPILMGAAATFGTQRVSTSTLSTDVALLNNVYQANPSLQRDVQYTPAQMPRLVLMWLVRFRVVDDIAQRNGVQVTPAEAQQGLVQAAVQIEQQTGSPITREQLAIFTAMPPNLTDQFGRYEATIEKLAVAFTGAKSASSLTPAQQQQFAARIGAEVAASTKRLDIKINPRYGRLDAAQLTINAPDNPLVRAAALGTAQRPAA
jgi:hypothetical protein